MIFVMNHFKGGHLKGSAKPNGDPEEERETEDSVPLAQRPSGGGCKQLLEAPGFGYTASPTGSPASHFLLPWWFREGEDRGPHTG